MSDPFVTYEELSAALGATVDEDDALAVLALDSACEAVRSYLDNPVNATEYDMLFDGTGRHRLMLPYPPIRAVDTVTVDEEDLGEGTDYVLTADGILHRLEAEWPYGHRNIKVVFTAGWDLEEAGSDGDYLLVPGDLKEIALALACRIYRHFHGAFDVDSAADAAALMGLTGQEKTALARYADLKVG